MALTVLQPPATGKALKTRPAYKGMLRGKLPALCGVGALFRWLCVRLVVLAESLPRPGTAQFKRFYLWPGAKGGCWCFTHCPDSMSLEPPAQFITQLCSLITKLMCTALAIAAAVTCVSLGLQPYIKRCIGFCHVVCVHVQVARCPTRAMPAS